MDVSNEQVAILLDRVADQLETQRASTFRVSAYRAGAAQVRGHDGSIQTLALAEGREGLEALPHIGKSLAAAIDEIVHTGELHDLHRLDGKHSPVELLERLPGIGPALAQRIDQGLGVDSLEALELAAHDGRLAEVPGFGEQRVLAVQKTLATMLHRSARSGARRFEELERAGAKVTVPEDRAVQPPIALLLAIDRHYLTEATAGRLGLIAPQRNNPGGKAWLPVLHLERDGWHFTVLASNSDQAHRLGHTHDWVVIYHDRDGQADQCTVVTEYRGPLRGRRVVRGREQETARHYRGAASGSSRRERHPR